MKYFTPAVEDGFRRILSILFRYTAIFYTFYIIAIHRIPKSFFDTIAERPLQSYIFGLLALSIIGLTFKMVVMSVKPIENDKTSDKSKPD